MVTSHPDHQGAMPVYLDVIDRLAESDAHFAACVGAGGRARSGQARLCGVRMPQLPLSCLSAASIGASWLLCSRTRSRPHAAVRWTTPSVGW